jgi:hypothetical protein
MSYSECDGQVILTMSKEDYGFLLRQFGQATGAEFPYLVAHGRIGYVLEFLNRLNQGNAHYTPYHVEAEKK